MRHERVQPREDRGRFIQRDVGRTRDDASGCADPAQRRVRTDVAQRNRQHGARRLHDAELRRELGERRVAIGRDLDRALARVERAAGVVAQLGGDLDHEPRARRKRRVEDQVVDQRVAVARIAAPRRPAARGRAVFAELSQHDARRRLPRHRRRERQREAFQRHASRLLVLALAPEARGEGRPHLVLEELFLLGGDAAGGLDPRAPRQRELRFGREALARLEHHDARVVDLPVEALDDRVAVVAFDHAQADRIGQTGDADHRVRLDRLARRRSVELEREALVLVDDARPGRAIRDRGTARRERELALAVDRCAGERAQVGGEREAAAHTGREILREREDPRLRVGPTRRAFRAALDRERIGGAARIAERNHRLGEARAHLADLLGGSLRRERLDARGGAGAPIALARANANST